MGIQVSPCALGTMNFGAMLNTGREDSIRLVHRALDAGAARGRSTMTEPAATPPGDLVRRRFSHDPDCLGWPTSVKWDSQPERHDASQAAIAPQPKLP